PRASGHALCLVPTRIRLAEEGVDGRNTRRACKALAREVERGYGRESCESDDGQEAACPLAARGSTRRHASGCIRGGSRDSNAECRRAERYDRNGSLLSRGRAQLLAWS